MSTIDVPTAGDPVEVGWGETVARKLNRLFGHGALRASCVGHDSEATGASLNSLVPNGGGALLPVAVPAGMALYSYHIYRAASAALVDVECALYRDTGASTFSYVTGSYQFRAWGALGPSAAWAELTISGGALELPPGFYYLAIRNAHATNTLDILADPGIASGHNIQAYTPTTFPTLSGGGSLDPTGFALSSWQRHVHLYGAVAAGAGPFSS